MWTITPHRKSCFSRLRDDAVQRNGARVEIDAGNAMAFEILEEHFKWVSHYAHCAAEAAARQSPLGVELNLTEMRRVLTEAVATRKLIV